MVNVTIRPASLNDLASMTEIYNHYVVNTHFNLDLQPFIPEQRISWFRDHSDNQRYRLLLAEDADGNIAGYVGTGKFLRAKDAYDSTVEITAACRPDTAGKGIGTKLYAALFAAIAQEDINRVVAVIAQPNLASNALHKRFGFQEVGCLTEVGQKFGKYWDVMFMERPLILP